MKIARVLVKWVAKGDYDVCETAGSQYAANFVHNATGRYDVFQDCVALDSGEHAGSKRQLMRVRLHVHSGDASNIEIYETGNPPVGASEVQIVTA
jgi:hypothetical protein